MGGGRKQAKKARKAKQAGPYRLTYADGRVVTMTQAAFERARADGKVPKGTMVSHPGGWYVVGATIGDVFEFD